jgi:outer membrane protein assembly factor BamB
MQFTRPLTCIVASFLLWAVSPALHADNWPNWRGPQANGVAAAGDYPIEWSVGTDGSAGKNVLWSIDMPGQAGSTPIVWEDKFFITCNEDGKNLARCYNWQGQLQWQTAVGDERPGKHRKASGCNSSPVTDGKYVYVYFKSGDLACLDMQGQVVWKTNLQKQFAEDTLWWDLGTSPVLTRDHVVVAVIQSGPAYVVAFDRLTGDVAWKVDRMLNAPDEANQSYSTPLVIDHDGKQLLVVLGADHVTGHDAATGQEVWRVSGFNPTENGYNRSIASPVYADGVIVAPYDRGTSLTAISIDGDVLWRGDAISADVPTPAAADGKVYVCNDQGKLVCLDLRTGDELWSVATSKNRNAFSSSPILAGNRLYVVREDAAAFVFDATGNHDLLATNQLEGFTVATPVLVDGKILIRTAEHLYCIGRD